MRKLVAANRTRTAGSSFRYIGSPLLSTLKLSGSRTTRSGMSVGFRSSKVPFTLAPALMRYSVIIGEMAWAAADDARTAIALTTAAPTTDKERAWTMCEPPAATVRRRTPPTLRLANVFHRDHDRRVQAIDPYDDEGLMRPAAVRHVDDLP